MTKSTDQPSSTPAAAQRVQFRAVLESAGKTATGFVVPAELVEQLNHGKRPPVLVTIGVHTYRNTVAVMGGQFMIGVSAAHRESAGVEAGDTLDITLQLDIEVRDVAVPADLAGALAAVPAARAFFDGLSYSARKWHVVSVEEAKTPETRQRRIDKSVAMLSEGRAR